VGLFAFAFPYGFFRSALAYLDRQIGVQASYGVHLSQHWFVSQVQEWSKTFVSRNNIILDYRLESAWFHSAFRTSYL
jgi:hypothetical protein